MTLYSDPPHLRDGHSNKPTLLVCWWVTLFCTVIVILRVIGRFIRTERLFFEDKIAAVALIPLYIRMGCVHVILRYGTNNADFTGIVLTENEVHDKQIASGLVLASRIFYAATLWVFKATILEFLKRLTSATWQRSHEIALVAIRWVLVATFAAVVISDLVECQPFDHYWQVLPDPGGQCRQGFAQLITMATCNVVTDLMLVIFPIPIIITSNMSIKRKTQLVLLFSLSLSVVGVTLYRVPRVIWLHGEQQYRSLLASVELLFAAASANALVLGSFVRDRGIKKQKFRRTSAADSIDRTSSNNNQSNYNGSVRRPTIQRHWGSDEDLVRDIGMGVAPELREGEGGRQYTPASTARDFGDDAHRWPREKRSRDLGEGSDDSLLPHEEFAKVEQPGSHRRMSFFDVGGLLDGSTLASSSKHRRESASSSIMDNAMPLAAPSSSMPAGSGGMRRGSTALLQDLGGLLSPQKSRPTRTRSREGTELETIPQSNQEHSFSRSGRRDPVLNDPGGLLS